MEHEDSLPCSKYPATSPNPEPHESNPHPKSYFPKIPFNIILHIQRRIPSDLYTSGFATIFPYAFLISPCKLRVPTISSFLIVSP
jgi:hypothetical protein